jgi:hypothetical protein
VATHNNIVQGKEETLRDYIERFIREAIEVKGTNDKLNATSLRKALEATPNSKRN